MMQLDQEIQRKKDLTDEMEQKKQLLGIDLKQYEIKGSESEWVDALKLPTSSSYVTVKRYTLLLNNILFF